MALILSRFAAGDTDYVTKMNSDNALIEAAVNANTTQIAAIQGTGGTGGGGANFDELWKNSGLIGASSYRITLQSSPPDLSFTSGSVWFLGQAARARNTAETLITFAGLASGTYYVNVDTAGVVTVSTAQADLTLYEVCYTAPSFLGNPIRLAEYLIDGADYERMLSSPTYGSFERVGDRLSVLEAGTIATMFDEIAVSIGSPITWDHTEGRVRDDEVITSQAASYIDLADDTTHYIEIDPSTANISYATGGHTAGAIPLRVVSITGGALASSADFRTWAMAQGAGGGGGLKNSGTTDETWSLNREEAATGSDAILNVHRGTETDASSNVNLRWNETLDRWEFTNDGFSWVGMGTVEGLNFGGGVTTRFTAVASQPLVVDLDMTDPTVPPPYEGLSVSAHTSTTTVAVMLRGYMVDSFADTQCAGSALGIVFWKDSGDGLTNDAAGRIYATRQSSPIAVTIVVPVSDQQLVYSVDAASDGSADVKVALVGYWDEVTGIGTQLVSNTADSGGTGNLSANTGTTDFVIGLADFGAAMNRGIIHYLATSGTIGAGSLYDIEIYASNPATVSQLLFQALNIDASAEYVTRLPWHYQDLNSALQLYLRISNAGASAGLFTFEWRGERFA